MKDCAGPLRITVWEKLRHAAISFLPGNIICYRQTFRNIPPGFNLTKQILMEGTDSTAFVGYNDMVAIGILDALYEMKYRVPADFSVCGFDNVPMASMNRISLTTVEHSIEAKGREAVDIIARLRDSKTKISLGVL